MKKSFELLKAKLASEGLVCRGAQATTTGFSPACGALLVVREAAGYADFIKILNDRWGGIKVDVAHVQVQGVSAPDQIIRGVEIF